MTVVLVLLPRVSYRGLEITRPRLRSLLALLAEDLRTGCGTTRLVAALWPDAQPANPAKALQVLVSQARAHLGSDVITSTPIGYRLTLSADQIDASAVVLSASACTRSSRTGDHASALQHAEQGLALWEGTTWDTGPADPLSALREARAPVYRSLVRARALALSRLDRPAEALDELTELVHRHPRDEEVLIELLRCEAATFGPSTALARYDTYRLALRDDLGSDPGPALQDVHQKLLQGERPAVRSGVPHELNPLLGRDDDIAAVAGLLRTSRVTSIVGAGGLGKTRLAHVVSRQAEQRVVHLVALAGVTTDDDVVNEVASALGVGRASAGRRGLPADVLTGIVSAFGPGPALLVLDNCEHVVRGAADLVHALVSMSKDLRVLTTSRAPLGLSSEAVYLLPELSLPTAAELFRQRASAARPGVELPADVVEELCGHLDGLPLAVELAAARVRVMSVTALARRLNDRFTVLRGGARDAPARHRTLHAVIDWSWHLLDPGGQAAMRALSVFPGGFTEDAARHVLGDADTLLVLEQLVDQSLLKVSDTASDTRFRMLETVREFSTARRDEAGETARVTDRFLAWARDFGVADHESVFGAEVVSSAQRIRAEQDNLVHALRHGLDREDGATVAATSAVLTGLWTFESDFTRLAALARDIAWVLSHFRPEPVLVGATRAALVLCAANSFVLRGPSPARFLVALRRLPSASPDTLTGATEIVLMAGPGELHTLCDSAEPLVAAIANAVASYVRESDNDLDGALKAAERTLTALEGQETPWFKVAAESRIGELCLQAGRGEEARRHAGRVLAAVEEFGAWSSAIRVRWAMVLACLQCGAVDEAGRWLEQAAQSDVDDTAGQLMLDSAARAEILLARGDVVAGLRLWRRIAERLGDTGNTAAVPGSVSWTAQARAMAVIAHAHHDRLDLVREITASLPDTLSAMITTLGGDLPVCGVLLLAVAVTELDTGDAAAGARMIALAERLRFRQDFQPTMSAERARLSARQADQSAYADAVSSYAGLGHAELRAAAMTALRARGLITGPDPS